jgi:hypothetical protein
VWAIAFAYDYKNDIEEIPHIYDRLKPLGNGDMFQLRRNLRTAKQGQIPDGYEVKSLVLFFQFYLIFFLIESLKK